MNFKEWFKDYICALREVVLIILVQILKQTPRIVVALAFVNIAFYFLKAVQALGSNGKLVFLEPNRFFVISLIVLFLGIVEIYREHKLE